MRGKDVRTKEASTFINIENKSRPYLKIAKNIGICNGLHKAIKAELVYPDQSFADKKQVKITFARIIPETLRSRERKMKILHRMKGPKMGLYLRKFIFFFHFLFSCIC